MNTNLLSILGESGRNALRFNDAKVCKSFLLGCCPHEILASTVSVSSNNKNPSTNSCLQTLKQLHYKAVNSSRIARP